MSSRPKIAAVIPIRLGSTRLSQKAILKIDGKTIVQMVYENAIQSKLIDNVYIAGDDDILETEVRKFTENYIPTSKDHQSGSDRIIEAASKIDADIIVNIQGDEPLLQASVIDSTIRPLIGDNNIKVATSAAYFAEEEEMDDPSKVKVVIDRNNFALYFSRSVIPYHRDRHIHHKYLKHIGLYVYRKDFLMTFSSLPNRSLEQSEKLEQLRILESGHRIYVSLVDYNGFGIDTEDDFLELKKLMHK